MLSDSRSCMPSIFYQDIFVARPFGKPARRSATADTRPREDGVDILQLKDARLARLGSLIDGRPQNRDGPGRLLTVFDRPLNGGV